MPLLAFWEVITLLFPYLVNVAIVRLYSQFLKEILVVYQRADISPGTTGRLTGKLSLSDSISPVSQDVKYVRSWCL